MPPDLSAEELQLYAAHSYWEMSNQLGAMGAGFSFAFAILLLFWLYWSRKQATAEPLLRQFVDQGDPKSFVRTALVSWGAKLLFSSTLMFGLAVMQAMSVLKSSRDWEAVSIVLLAVCLLVSVGSVWRGAVMINHSFATDEATLFAGPGQTCLAHYNQRRANLGLPSMPSGASAA